MTLAEIAEVDLAPSRLYSAAGLAVAEWSAYPRRVILRLEAHRSSLTLIHAHPGFHLTLDSSRDGVELLRRALGWLESRPPGRPIPEREGSCGP